MEQTQYQNQIVILVERRHANLHNITVLEMADITTYQTTTTFIGYRSGQDFKRAKNKTRPIPKNKLKEATLRQILTC